jgi:DNA-binding transcriptional regulator YhcF (GntR family)
LFGNSQIKKRPFLQKSVNPKYQQIISNLHKDIAEKKILPGESLESITEVSRRYGVARETVVKAYRILKQAGTIDSIPGKGFFLLSDQPNEVPRVFLVLNSFNPYMQVLYNAFSDSLDRGIVDIFFHHHNIDIFRNLIQAYSGRYSHYIIKPFVHREVPDLLKTLDISRLLLLDRNEYIDLVRNSLCQDFQDGFVSALQEALVLLRSYKGICFVRSDQNPHPTVSFESFRIFLKKEGIRGEIIAGMTPNMIRKDHAYLVVTDDDLVTLLTISRNRSWVPGKDIGIISYNDSPLLEFIEGGITSLSIDFERMGKLAADFIQSGTPRQTVMRPELVIRGSL